MSKAKRLFLHFGLALILSFAAPAGAQAPGGGAAGEWRHYASDKASSRYSPLDQITPENIDRIELAWKWNVRDVEGATGEPTRSFRIMPLKIGERLYLSTGLNLVVALDAGTGELVWSFDPKAYDFPTPTHGGLGSKGVEYWTDGVEERILFGTGGLQLIALDAKTGKLIPDFGEDGVVDLSKGLGRPISRARYNVKSPPIVCRDTIIIGSVVNDLTMTQANPPGHIRGYDVRTGEMKWIFHTIAQAGEYGVETWERGSWQYSGNTNVWSLFSADEELGYVYLPLGTATNDWYGGHRLGDNLFAESLVCIDADTGERVWHFQAVHHGVWDYDFPCAPNLIDLTIDGRKIKAVAQVSKQGFTYVFDRVTGEPVWPIEERPVAPSDVPGERLSPTQPFPTKPPPFERQGIGEEDLIDFTPELRAEALEIASNYVLGPLFTPPSIGGENGKLGTISMPGITGGANVPGAGVDPESGMLYVQSVTLPWVLALKPGEPGRSDLRYHFKDWSKNPPGPRGLPLVKPPYARITAIDLKAGEIAWQKPLGDGPRKKINELIGDGTDVGPLGNTRFGTVSSNGVLVTKTLLMANETIAGDREAGIPGSGVLRVFDKATGEILWERKTEISPASPPMTYLHEGRQYLAFTGSSPSEGGRNFELYVFALPR